MPARDRTARWIVSLVPARSGERAGLTRTTNARPRAGSPTKTEARAYLRERVDEIEALRGGDLGALRRREMPTLNELADEYLAQHVCETNTLSTITWRLKRARDTFGRHFAWIVSRSASFAHGERRSRLSPRTRTSRCWVSCSSTQSSSDS